MNIDRTARYCMHPTCWKALANRIAVATDDRMNRARNRRKRHSSALDRCNPRASAPSCTRPAPWNHPRIRPGLLRPAPAPPTAAPAGPELGRLPRGRLLRARRHVLWPAVVRLGSVKRAAVELEVSEAAVSLEPTGGPGAGARRVPVPAPGRAGGRPPGRGHLRGGGGGARHRRRRPPDRDAAEQGQADAGPQAAPALALGDPTAFPPVASPPGPVRSPPFAGASSSWPPSPHDAWDSRVGGLSLWR